MVERYHVETKCNLNTNTSQIQFTLTIVINWGHGTLFGPRGPPGVPGTRELGFHGARTGDVTLYACTLELTLGRWIKKKII